MRRLMLVVLVLVIGTLPLHAQKSSRDPTIDSLLAEGYSTLNKYQQTRHLGYAREARDVFSEALRRARNDASAHLGLGLVYTALEGASIPGGLGDVTGLPNHTLALRHLGAALKAGAFDAKVYEALRTVALRELKAATVEEVVRLAEMAPPADERGRVAIAEVFIRAGSPERASSTLADASTGAGQRMLAIALLANSETRDRGGALYSATLASADSTLLEEFLLDARWLADVQEASLWSTLPWMQVRDRLRSFWQKRALTSAVTVSERLATHFQRVNHALDEFNFYRQRIARFAPDSMQLTINTAPAVGGVRSISPGIHGRLYQVDDRAFIYVRYGEPDQRIRTAGEELWNESWMYQRLAEKPVSFDFFLPIDASAGMKLDARGWTLVYDVMHCGKTSTLPYLPAYVRDRQSVDPRYTMILHHCERWNATAADADVIAQPMVKERYEFLLNAMVRDNALPTTRLEIPIMADVLQYQGGGGTTDVTAVVAWPLEAFTVTEGVYRVNASFFIADTLAQKTVRKDTLLTVRAAANGNAPAVRVHMTLTANAGERSFYRLRLADLNSDGLNAVIGDSIEVRTYTSNALSISDIALAAPADGGTWVRRDRRLSLLPRGARVRNFRIYYELYGLAPQTRYTTEITFTPENDALAKVLAKVRGSRTVQLKFEGRNETADSTIAELQAIGTELPSGNYTMRIEVTADGRSAMRERAIRIP